MDRRAEFTPAFRKFLEGKRRVSYEVQERRRYRDPKSHELRYTHGEWREVSEPSWRMEAIPQTLTKDDLLNDRLPAPIYIIKFDDGTELRSEVQESRMFHSHDLTVDFMCIIDSQGNKLDAFTWESAEINDYMATSQKRGLSGTLRLEEPEVAV